MKTPSQSPFADPNQASLAHPTSFPNGNNFPNPAPSPLGSPERPKSKKRGGPSIVLLCCAGFAIALMLGGGIYGILKFTKVLNSDRNDLIFHVVKKESLLVTIVDKGQLEAAENKDVICAVKASKGGQFSTTIKWVIDDGSHVNKDDKVVELDQSSLEDQKRTQQAAVDTAKAL